MFCHAWLPPRSLFVSNRDRQGVELDGRGDGEELGEVEGEETIFRLYCMRKESV